MVHYTARHELQKHRQTRTSRVSLTAIECYIHSSLGILYMSIRFQITRHSVSQRDGSERTIGELRGQLVLSLAAGSHTAALQWKADGKNGTVPWYSLSGIGGFFQVGEGGTSQNVLKSARVNCMNEFGRPEIGRVSPLRHPAVLH